LFLYLCRYSWHFPELVTIVNDNYLFAKLAKFIKNKSTLSQESLAALEEVTQDSVKAQQIIDAAKMSMGQDISPIDLINIEQFATRVVQLTDYRRNLHIYLTDKMNTCAPNLSALIGNNQTQHYLHYNCCLIEHNSPFFIFCLAMTNYSTITID
jgi:nucleolar protein 56